MNYPSRMVLLVALLFASAVFAQAQVPQWIWIDGVTNGAATVFFRKTFRTPPLTWNARITVAADDSAEVFLNGVLIGECRGPQQPMRSEVSVRLNQGENVVAVRSVNKSGAAGLLVDLNLLGKTNVFSDGSWLAATQSEPGWNTLAFNAAHWRNAVALGTNGVAPWGNVLSIASATPAESLTVPEGFRAELLRSALPDEGSWICMTFDERGRLWVSPQGDDRPLLRLTLTNNAVSRVEKMEAPIRYAMGLLFAHGSLYANARGGEGAGLYRLRDLNGNDHYETNECQLLKKFEGAGEHGYHAVRLGPDGKIYLINGNGTKVPPGLSPQSPHRNYREDVLSLNPDEGEKSPTPAPACYVLRTDPDGKEWEMWMGGLRNTYDFDFNDDGQFFAFDSDMEWDWGTPWYRPTRIIHGVSGGEYGWREGARLWPDDYEDGLPGVVDVGIGSPTGVVFGGRAKFPSKYRRAIFGCDWSYGRIFAIHLKPSGASYSGEVETFLRGTPLNLTDIEIGPDGALYFITGGRGTQSGLYRVSYTGPKESTARDSTEKSNARELAQRAALEEFHGHSDPAALSAAWPYLGNSDRFLRYAARVAIESQDPALWTEKALGETNALAGLTALLALARVGSKATQPVLLEALRKFSPSVLNEAEMMLMLRVMELSIVRQGRPAGEFPKRMSERLGLLYPAKSWPLNRELCRLTLFLDAPGAISKTIERLEKSTSLEEQFHYVAQLRNAREGWSPDLRRRYFAWWLKPREGLARRPEMDSWFADAGRAYVDGAYVDKYLREFRAEAVAALSPEERRELAPILSKPFEKARSVPGVARNFVREWTMEDLLPELSRVSSGRNFSRGRQAFVDAQCLTCHRFGGDGGVVGPELTAAGSKYDARSLLESIVEPSKVLNEQYSTTAVELDDGESVTGRVVAESDAEVVVETDPANGTRETIPRRRVKSIRASGVSPMPAGLLNSFSKEEILDLLAYLASGGKEGAAAFSTK
jgi:putative heme-binding domain-containing protein